MTVDRRASFGCNDVPDGFHQCCEARNFRLPVLPHGLPYNKPTGQSEREVRFLDPVHERSKKKHEELHSCHGVLEDLPSSVFFFIVDTALARLPRRALVFNLVDEGTAATTPAGAPVCAPKMLTVAVLGGLQEHPVQGVKELCLSDTQFILVA